jgi:hypothetical protein
MSVVVSMTRAVVVGLLLIPPSAYAQDTQPSATHWDFWATEDMLYYEPLVADPRAARVQITFPGWAKELPHSELPGTRFAWQITLGRELPIVGVRTDTVGQRVGKGRFGAGLWIPVSFHMIEDFKDESNPIVDTDYRFGFMSKYQFGLTDDSWLGIRFTPWAHESTHLGDEYTIIAQRRPDFERINVSYEYREYGISYEKVFGDDVARLIARHGGISLLGEDGYYSNHLLGSDQPTLTVSEKNFEPSLGFELRGWFWRNRDFVLSIDVRDKLAYHYHRAPGEEETRHWSTSLAVGRSVRERTRGVPLRDYFVHYYRGVNPYGQLRSQSDFWSLGLSFIFGV